MKFDFVKDINENKKTASGHISLFCRSFHLDEGLNEKKRQVPSLFAWPADYLVRDCYQNCRIEHHALYNIAASMA